MADPTGVADLSDDELTRDERAALAAWAEDEPPDGFADSILEAWTTERSRTSDFDELEGVTFKAAASRPRINVAPGRRRGSGTLGIVATFAAAAAVMLMVRVVPRASDRAGADAIPVALASSSGVEGVELASAGATTVLAQHCSPCHDSLDSEAKSEALDVFDLRRPDWWSTMSEAELSEARVRIYELGAATDDERSRVDAFVGAELSARGHAG